MKRKTIKDVAKATEKVVIDSVQFDHRIRPSVIETRQNGFRLELENGQKFTITVTKG